MILLQDNSSIFSPTYLFFSGEHSQFGTSFLGGGNSNISYFHPIPGEDEPIFDVCIFFVKWVGEKPPTINFFPGYCWRNHPNKTHFQKTLDWKLCRPLRERCLARSPRMRCGERAKVSDLTTTPNHPKNLNGGEFSKGNGKIPWVFFQEKNLGEGEILFHLARDIRWCIIDVFILVIYWISMNWMNFKHSSFKMLILRR